MTENTSVYYITTDDKLPDDFVGLGIEVDGDMGVIESIDGYEVCIRSLDD